MRIRNAPIAAIWRIKLFSDLTDRELRTVAACFTAEVFNAGSIVVEEGATGSGFFVIQSGSAKVNVGDREVNRLGAGDHFGEIALLIADTPRSATVTAELHLKCQVISRSSFQAMVESNPSIAWKMLQNLARQLVGAEHRS